jgi:hypothetical protein
MVVPPTPLRLAWRNESPNGWHPTPLASATCQAGVSLLKPWRLRHEICRAVARYWHGHCQKRISAPPCRPRDGPRLGRIKRPNVRLQSTSQSSRIETLANRGRPCTDLQVQQRLIEAADTQVNASSPGAQFAPPRRPSGGPCSASFRRITEQTVSCCEVLEQQYEALKRTPDFTSRNFT